MEELGMATVWDDKMGLELRLGSHCMWRCRTSAASLEFSHGESGLVAWIHC